MSAAYSTYELEKLIDVRRQEMEKSLQRRSLIQAARNWAIAQSLAVDSAAEVSRRLGSRV